MKCRFPHRFFILSDFSLLRHTGQMWKERKCLRWQPAEIGGGGRERPGRGRERPGRCRERPSRGREAREMQREAREMQRGQGDAKKGCGARGHALAHLQDDEYLKASLRASVLSATIPSPMRLHHPPLGDVLMPL